MKVLHVTNSLGSGGMERQLIELMAGLLANGGFELELVLLSDDVHYTSLYEMNIPVHYIPRRYKKDPTVFWRLYRLFHATRPDIVHIWQSMNAMYSVPAAFILGIPLVNGMIRIAPDRLDFTNWFRSRFTFLFSKKVVANSLAGLKSYKVSREKGICIHNGFNLERIKDIENGDIVRYRLGLGNDVVVGIVASFSEKKDHGTIIQAAQDILTIRNDVTFVFVGDGPMLEESRQQVQERFRDKVKFLGKRTNVESIINVFDIGVLSTYTEGISNSIMEYMALGKPVVATEGGGTKELVIDNETGFLVKSRDPQDMADKILRLINDRDLCTAMGRAGKHTLVEKFSYQAMIDAYISLYTSIYKAAPRKCRLKNKGSSPE